MQVSILILRGVPPDPAEPPSAARLGEQCCATVQDRGGPRRCRGQRAGGEPLKPFLFIEPAAQLRPVPFCPYHLENVWDPVVQYYHTAATPEEELRGRLFLDSEMLNYDVEPWPSYSVRYTVLRQKIHAGRAAGSSKAAPARAASRPPGPDNLFDVFAAGEYDEMLQSASDAVPPRADPFDAARRAAETLAAYRRHETAVLMPFCQFCSVRPRLSCGWVWGIISQWRAKKPKP